MRLISLATALLAALPALAQEAPFAPGTVPAGPEDGGPRYLRVVTDSTSLNMRMAPSGDAAIADKLPNGAALSNLGCTAGASRAWCDVQLVGGGPRGYAAADFLAPARGPNGDIAMGYDDSALRAGQGDFDATAPSLPCSAGACSASVSRGTGGDAIVVITLPDGQERIIFFALGHPIGVNSSEAMPLGEFKTSRDGDVSTVVIGDERYEIPDALPLGG